jgi:hypothetical protein
LRVRGRVPKGERQSVQGRKAECLRERSSVQGLETECSRERDRVFKGERQSVQGLEAVFKGERQSVQGREAECSRERGRVFRGERQSVQARSPNNLKSNYWLYHVCLSVCLYGTMLHSTGGIFLEPYFLNFTAICGHVAIFVKFGHN